MDINEIYFSNLKKFDGKKTRRLNTIEISQIAGRAGRFKNDGVFGTTGECSNLNSDEIENIEKILRCQTAKQFIGEIIISCLRAPAN